MEYHFERVRFIDNDAKAKCLVYALLESGAAEARTYFRKWEEALPREDVPQRNELVAQIKQLQKDGLNTNKFRQENNCFALPNPTEVNRKSGRIKHRIYCSLIFVQSNIEYEKDILILLFAGLKTTQKAQNCPNVSALFHESNKIALAIRDNIDCFQHPYPTRTTIETYD